MSRPFKLRGGSRVGVKEEVSAGMKALRQKQAPGTGLYLGIQVVGKKEVQDELGEVGRS